MQKKWHILLTMAILAIGLAGFTGCSDDDDNGATTAPTVKPYVYAMAFLEGPMRKAEGDPGYAYVSVADAPMIPQVTLNGESAELNPEMTIYGGSLGFYGEFLQDAGNAVALQVDLDGERGGASTTIPDEFDIVGDQDVYLAYFSSHTFAWTAATGAERYWVWADFEATYLDTAGVTRYWDNSIATVTTGTSISFTATDMFPPAGEVDSFTYFWGDLDVTAINGPMQAGEGVNITGAVTGYLIGVGGGIDWDIEEIVPAKAVEDREQSIDYLGAYIEMMR